MKWISLLILAFSVQSFASNPLIRACNTTGGQFHAVNINGDLTGFCQYGSAMIDSLSVLQTTAGERISTASQLALSEGSNCEDSGQALVYPDIENAEFFLCRFPDGSILEMNTLHGGVNSPANAGLVEALKIRF